MKLYYAPGACSLSQHINLREAGLEFDLVNVDLRAKRTEGDRDFLQINPKGQVPTLERDDGQILTENSVIAEYIADLAPQSGLIPPAGTIERYRVMEWLSFVGSELHKTFGPLFRPNTPDDYKAIAYVEQNPGHAGRHQPLGGLQTQHFQGFRTADPSSMRKFARTFAPRTVCASASPASRALTVQVTT